MESWGRRRGLPGGLNPDAIRAWRGFCGRTVWHEAADDTQASSIGCTIDTCEWIKSGLLDTINLRTNRGRSPLHFAVLGGKFSEAKTRWMVANGADVNAVNKHNISIFCQACYGSASLSFLQESPAR